MKLRGPDRWKEYEGTVYALPYQRVSRFRVTEDHIKLLRKFIVEFESHCEYGAPAIDPKRPYGNSCVEDDIADILGIEVPRGGFGDGFTDSPKHGDVLRRIRTVHRETEIALQIFLQTGEMKTGWYESGNGYEWQWSVDQTPDQRREEDGKR